MKIQKRNPGLNHLILLKSYEMNVQKRVKRSLKLPLILISIK